MARAIKCRKLGASPPPSPSGYALRPILSFNSPLNKPGHMVAGSLPCSTRSGAECPSPRGIVPAAPAVILPGLHFRHTGQMVLKPSGTTDNVHRQLDIHCRIGSSKLNAPQPAWNFGLTSDHLSERDSCLFENCPKSPGAFEPRHGHCERSTAVSLRQPESLQQTTRTTTRLPHRSVSRYDNR